MLSQLWRFIGWFEGFFPSRDVSPNQSTLSQWGLRYPSQGVLSQIWGVSEWSSQNSVFLPNPLTSVIRSNFRREPQETLMTWAEPEWAPQPWSFCLCAAQLEPLCWPPGLSSQSTHTSLAEQGSFFLCCAWHWNVLTSAPFSLHADYLVSRQAQLKSTPLLEGTRFFGCYSACYDLGYMESFFLHESFHFYNWSPG